MKTHASYFSARTLKPLALAVMLCVLAACKSTSSAPEQDNSLNRGQGSAAQAGVSGATHTVHPGETMNMIARQHGVSVTNLAAWNNITNPNQVNVGQVLRLTPPSGGEAGAETHPIGSNAPESVEVKPIAGGAAAAGAAKGGKTPYSDSAWAQSQSGSGDATTPSAKPTEAGSGEWLWPVGGKVTSGFSETANMKGIDVAAKAGDPVLASRSGKVAYAGSGLRGYGKLVIISHDGDYLSAYAHNQTLLVKEGEMVKQGQKIAEVGSSDTDKSKLHFEIRKQGRPVDPIKYLPAR